MSKIGIPSFIGKANLAFLLNSSLFFLSKVNFSFETGQTIISNKLSSKL